jgi:hypothetical protein
LTGRSVIAVVGVASLPIFVGAAIASEPGVGPGTAGMLLLFASLAIGGIAARKLFADLQRYSRFAYLGTAILATGIVLAVVLPGMALLTGSRESRVVRLGLNIPDLEQSVEQAFLLFLAALCAFVIGEAVVLRRRPPAKPERSETTDGPLVYCVLLAIGLLTQFSGVGPSTEEALAQRGYIQGQGLVTLLSWSVPLALAIAILSRHWGSRRLVLVSALVFSNTVLFWGVRSPLVLVAIAVIIRLIADGARNRRVLRASVLVGITVYVGAVMAIAVSSWRSEVSRGHQSSLLAEFARAPANPFAELAARANIDTLDGLTLALQVEPDAVGATWRDASKIATGFVPRKIWPEKPEWLAVSVSRHYLGVKAHSGIFLSGPGYAYIVFGGVAGIVLAFLALGMFSGFIYSRVAPRSAEALLLSYFLVRFFFGGDSFDAFHVLGLLVLLVCARAVARVAADATRSQPATALPGLRTEVGS